MFDQDQPEVTSPSTLDRVDGGWIDDERVRAQQRGFHGGWITSDLVGPFMRTPGTVAWLSSFGEIDAIAVESTGSYAAALVRYLREHDVSVVEVNQPHAHTRRRIGKSDPIDAEMAARLALAGKATVVPKQTDGIVEAIRMLRLARNSAVKRERRGFRAYRGGRPHPQDA